MVNIVGIRFKKAGKVYYFSPAGLNLALNDTVVVKTSRGVEIGFVAIAPKEVADTEVTEPLKEVLRKADPADLERSKELETRAREALVECRKIVQELNLNMKLLSAEYSLDGNRLTFLFSAEERVDFRELVRRLSARFKLRVELRQIGSRDEARLLGSCGRCGRPLCCVNFLEEFQPVSIKMAKEQDLPLNPMKISGLCGRLMCCLAYESGQYHAMKEKMPRVGQIVKIPQGQAKVVGTNALKETVTAELESGASVEVPLKDVIR